MNKGEQQFNQWFDEYANGIKVFEEADMKQAYLQGRADLEKENAELKSGCGMCYRKDKEQLTNAKEIINDCVCELQNILFYKMRNKERIASTLDKAEQFLNNEVEK